MSSGNSNALCDDNADTQSGMLSNVLGLQTGATAWSRKSCVGSQLTSLVSPPVKRGDFYSLKHPFESKLLTLSTGLCMLIDGNTF